MYNNVKYARKKVYRKMHFETSKSHQLYQYLMQDMEIDAIAFAHKMMLEHFEVKTLIPKDIIENVNTRLKIM